MIYLKETNHSNVDWEQTDLLYWVRPRAFKFGPNRMFFKIMLKTIYVFTFLYVNNMYLILVHLHLSTLHLQSYIFQIHTGTYRAVQIKPLSNSVTIVQSFLKKFQFFSQRLLNLFFFSFFGMTIKLFYPFLNISIVNVLGRI